MLGDYVTEEDALEVLAARQEVFARARPDLAGTAKDVYARDLFEIQAWKVSEDKDGPLPADGEDSGRE